MEIAEKIIGGSAMIHADVRRIGPGARRIEKVIIVGIHFTVVIADIADMMKFDDDELLRRIFDGIELDSGLIA